jgi:activator of 2-hydroxyglutaryl-CoA dehydratase
MSNAKQTIEAGKAVLGIEFGSTRIKAVLVNEGSRSHPVHMTGKTV